MRGVFKHVTQKKNYPSSRDHKSNAPSDGASRAAPEIRPLSRSFPPTPRTTPPAAFPMPAIPLPSVLLNFRKKPLKAIVIVTVFLLLSSVSPVKAERPPGLRVLCYAFVS